jgi:hypothetical protein
MVVPLQVADDHLVPPHQPTELARLLARARHDAADVAEDEQVRHLAARGRGHRLVERGHPALEVALQDRGPPEVRERGGLEVGVARASRDVECGLAMGADRGRIDGAVGHRELEPAAFARAGFVLGKQPFRPRQPAVARRVVADGLEILAAQPQGDRGRLRPLGALAVRDVRALAVIQRTVEVAQPPPGATAPVVSGSARAGTDGVLEGRTRRVPIAGQERLLAPGERCRASVHRHRRIMAAPGGASHFANGRDRTSVRRPSGARPS